MAACVHGRGRLRDERVLPGGDRTGAPAPAPQHRADRRQYRPATDGGARCALRCRLCLHRRFDRHRGERRRAAAGDPRFRRRQFGRAHDPHSAARQCRARSARAAVRPHLAQASRTAGRATARRPPGGRFGRHGRRKRRYAGCEARRHDGDVLGCRGRLPRRGADRAAAPGPLATPVDPTASPSPGGGDGGDPAEAARGARGADRRRGARFREPPACRRPDRLASRHADRGRQASSRVADLSERIDRLRPGSHGKRLCGDRRRRTRRPLGILSPSQPAGRRGRDARPSPQTT